MAAAPGWKRGGGGRRPAPNELGMRERKEPRGLILLRAGASWSFHNASPRW